MRLTADGGADCVSDADDERAPLFAIAQRHQRVRRLACRGRHRAVTSTHHVTPTHSRNSTTLDPD